MDTELTFEIIVPNDLVALLRAERTIDITASAPAVDDASGLNSRLSTALTAISIVVTLASLSQCSTAIAQRACDYATKHHISFDLSLHGAYEDDVIPVTPTSKPTEVANTIQNTLTPPPKKKH